MFVSRADFHPNVVPEDDAVGGDCCTDVVVGAALQACPKRAKGRQRRRSRCRQKSLRLLLRSATADRKIKEEEAVERGCQEGFYE